MTTTTDLTIEAKWASRTRPVDGGHLAWTGAYALRYGHQFHSPAAIAFRIRTGRDPIGNVQADCERWRCVEPAHVEDQVGRQRTRAHLRAVRGLGPRPAVCVNGHDQALHGRLDRDCRAYCDTCARGNTAVTA